ncbi:DNA-processing protein DprA [Rhodococcus sp. H36-A4]|uniref:DNA-processing protein DprA n=1 Tax=Rhodococcus sp. H36-A4 TaxID=3004353 RepID=UPI0022AF3EBD|nr:DNA-processing protein DprA [Rhodococcus sp. H36-A4]MCZ4078490.1 DNA-processing protein DprA [Rhodococcus sp. H36-A4]
MTTHDPRRLAWAYLSRVAQGPHRVLRDFAAEAGPEGAADAVSRGALGERLQVRSHIDTAQADLDLVASQGGRLITPDDDEWPMWRLLAFDGAGMPVGNDQCAPLALWVLGAVSVAELTERAVSIVGTRAATSYGEHVTAEIAGDLAVDGWTILSGAAFGIDAAAHRAALGVGGSTVAVLACGVDRAYPSGHSRLLHRIAKTGAVISEYAPGTTPAKHRFLARNRLVAGLGSAVVIVEAGWRSGARNTAGWARKLGRPVLAVPGPVTSAASKGCHRMIREGEACLVADAHDVVAEAGMAGETDEGRPSMFREIDALSESALLVYEALPASGTLSPRELSDVSSLPLATVRSVLPLLELDGFVASDETGWSRVART